MFWILTIGGGILGLFVIAILVGFLLPANYAFSIERTVPASPQQIWQMLHQPADLPIAGKQCRSVETTGAAPLTWIEDLGASRVTYQVIEETMPQSMTIHGRDSVVPMQFDAVINLTPVANATRIDVSIKGRIDNGTFHVPFFRLIVHLGGAKAGFRDYLKRVEQGIDSSTR